MSIPELIAIIERIVTSTHTDTDVQALRKMLGNVVAAGARSVAIQGDANGATIATGDGNVIIHITFQSDGLQVGERVYQGEGADVLRSLLQEFVQPQLEINWQQVSRRLLEERLQLTTNPMTRGEDIAYRVEQVYVPLGLVERKKVPRRKQDVSPEQGSQLYREGQEQGKRGQEQEKELREEVEVTQRFEHEQFLEQVLQQGQSPKSQGKRVAIIGEPGAGKTTLLQQIASWVAETLSESVVIWISLADLQSDTLETYLEKRWLQRIIRETGGAEVSIADKQQFGAQFKQGQVWLLLDGLDEMQVSGNSLSEIHRQLQEGGWLQQARVILTCRLNLWDGNRNSLEQFDTYRTLEFSYPEQVEQFIGQWFAPHRKVDLGQALCTALKESGRERIRDLVKNPLRLTLLCFSWYLQQGRLPETQAELYQRFVDRIYEWKQEQFPTTPEEREQLNQALARLSLAAIDTDARKQTRFRLRQEFVNRFLPGTLFDRVLKVGWLNKVGVDADDPTQAVYAFYHPTFEEYFAALGIDDGRFFLNPAPKNPMAKEANYQIFEHQWRQVFLLWLGRKDESLKPKKEVLIQALIRFKDRCGGFYSDRAFLLAAAGIAEFKDCAYGDMIVNQLIQWMFGDSNWLKQLWAYLFASAKTRARETWAKTAASTTDIQQMERLLVRLSKITRHKYTIWRFETGWNEAKRLITAETLEEIRTISEKETLELVLILETTRSEYVRRKVVQKLSKIDTNNEIAIQGLAFALKILQDKDTCRLAVETLGKIGMGNETAIQALVGVLETTQDEYTRWSASESLGKIGLSNETAAIQALVGVLETARNEDIRRSAAESLGKVAPGNETAIQALVGVLETTQDKYARWSVVESLGKIGSSNETVIQALVGVLETAQDEYTRWSASESLGKIGLSNETVIQALVRVLETARNEDIRRSAAESLIKVAPSNKTAIRALVKSLRHNLRSKEVYELMMKCAEMMPYQDFFQAFHSTRR